MSNRVEVFKTYKLYIGGKFSRTESGRYFEGKDAKGKPMANLCLASRKDVRNTVKAAVKAQEGWAERSAFNRGQILYRIAENLEGRKVEFEDILKREAGMSAAKAKATVERGIDNFVYFAGWTDKYQAVFSSVNPVASSHFNFSILEPTGMVSAIAADELDLADLSIIMASVIAGGNSLMLLSGSSSNIASLVLAEVLHHSDLPGGVVNILSGDRDELLEHIAGHMEINAMLYAGKKKDKKIKTTIEKLGAENLKRTLFWSDDLQKDKLSPYAIYDFQEVKTTWHPIEQIGGAAAGY